MEIRATGNQRSFSATNVPWSPAAANLPLEKELVMKIESPAFTSGASIPGTYSRFGDNKSPPLIFRDVPTKARSLALIVDDPDAPHGTFTHWVVFNLAPTRDGLEEGIRVTDARQGNNSWHEPRYGGPRPPNGEHRYFFRLYALDQNLDLSEGIERASVDEALRGHIIAETELMGRFATPVPAERGWH
jgi:Raf kinase inhibitor-like YbhB/YbcL family protein